MAKRNRYRELENLVTKVLLGDAAVTVLFLIFSRNDVVFMKVVTAVLTIGCSLLGVGWLTLTGEIKRRRSLWMVTGFACILVLVIMSLILKYPCPPVLG